jgi:nitrate/nitrite transporter NarK
MIGEWFPAKETGLAQGIYAGFGNFGSAAAAVTLPSLALYFGDNGWRYALLVTGAIAKSSISDRPGSPASKRPALPLLAGRNPPPESPKRL